MAVLFFGGIFERRSAYDREAGCLHRKCTPEVHLSGFNIDGILWNIEEVFSQPTWFLIPLLADACSCVGCLWNVI